LNVIDRVQVVAIAVSIVLLMVVLELVRRRKLVEEYSLLWILGSLAILGLSIWRGLLDIAARELGVFYPPSLLLMLLVVSVFVALLWFSVVLSRQRQQIDRLVEETAILGAEIRDLQAKDTTAAPEGLPSP
jgi:NO-binding membrane sensor protein with MHYT domain